MVKPDIVFYYSDSLIAIIEADEDDGHSCSRGSNINKWGNPWENSRDLNAELAKMQTGAQTLHNSFHKSILYVRCNSDNISLRLGDTCLSARAQLIVDKIIAAQSSIEMWPPKSFRLALIDMPPSRMQPSTAIQDTDDVYFSWVIIQQSINPPDPAVFLKSPGRRL
jgi:hypothetical protein